MTRVYTQLYVLTILIISVAGALSCGGGSSVSEERGSCAPTNLQYRPQDNGVFLSWRPNCDKNTTINGYNFYIVEADGAPRDFPNGDLEPHNRVPYPGDTNADRDIETAELKELENGRTYLAVVRILFPNDVMSKPSNVVRFTAMPSGELTLVGRYKGDNDGFSFAAGEYVEADGAANDLYFVSKADGDYLGSPDKLSFGLRTSVFSAVGSFASVDRSFGRVADGDGASEIKIAAGDVIDVQLTGGGAARVFVREISGAGESRSVTLEWYYNA
ncbi:MAG TPA: hypothetical protein VLB27_00045, partial [candidate division Zixibacteria bacterium]|nr:hypothetical protein [candidate division Zixibacteria bacterium]